VTHHGDEPYIDFGPGLVKSDRERMAFTFIHESSHAAVPAKDYAYTYRRRFWVLDAPSAFENADTYALFIVLAAQPDYARYRMPPVDEYTKLSTGQVELAKVTIADVETQIGLVAHDVDHIYRRVWNQVLNGSGNELGDYAGRFDIIRKTFPDEFPAQPTIARPDDVVLTGLHYRIRELRGPLDRAIGCTASDDNRAVFAGGTLYLPTAFFDLPTRMERLYAVVLALVVNVKEIPVEMQTRYAEVVTELAKAKGR
jgi:hypothetical protein